MIKRFELIPHTADLKLRVWGATREELFKNALIGMFASIEPHFLEGKESIKHEFNVEAYDLASLLVYFLSEALYLSDVYNEAYTDADIYLMTDTKLHVCIIGKPIKRFDVVEIKAVTYHELSVEQVNGQWQAEIVFDI